MNVIPWSQATPRVRHADISTAPPGHFIPTSWFSRLIDFDLWLVLDGRITLSRPGESPRVLTRGATIWLVPGDIFELQADTTGPYVNIYVHFELLDSAGHVLPTDQVQIPPTIGHPHDVAFFESTLRRVIFLEYQAQQHGSHAIRSALQTQASRLLKGVLHDFELAATLSDSLPTAGTDGHHAQVISSAQSWLYLHPDSTISIAELAQKFGYSQRHFCRLFREITGKSPAEAMIESRIDHAKKLLITSPLNITEIAAQLRYENIYYFSRQFKQVTGESPRSFRTRFLS